MSVLLFDFVSLSGINDILARRKYLEADESDTDSNDSEWDD